MKIILQIILLLLYIQSYYSLDYLPSVKELSINSTGLSITSFKFNRKSNSSPYIDRIFGSRSFYLHEEMINKSIHKGSNYDIFKQIYNDSILNMRKYINLSSNELWPSCSFEILGYTLLEIDIPFTNDYKHIKPAYGQGFILTDSNISIKCHYRGLYENWITDNWQTKPNYFPTIFYCPILTNTYCNIISNKNYIPLKLTMKLQNIQFVNQFIGRISKPYNIMNINEIDKQPDIGICVALSHISSDHDKIIANSAILYEWIRYHLKLGFKVFVYDRDGSHYNSTFNNRYSQLRPIDDDDKKHLIYYNYTIRGLLHPQSKGLRYDNTEGDSKDLFDKLFREGSKEKDKQYTLTHCRFEAMSTYNIHNVIVSDSDEFIYCSNVPNNAIEQSTYIRQLIKYYSYLNFDQMTLKQKILANRTESVRDCFISSALNGISIFDCISSFSYIAGFHLVKSLHIGLKCPMTGYHSSCAYDVLYPFTHDCLCDNVNIDYNCVFVHLSSNMKAYRQRFTDHQLDLIRHSTNEIELILNTESYNNHSYV